MLAQSQGHQQLTSGSILILVHYTDAEVNEDNGGGMQIGIEIQQSRYTNDMHLYTNSPSEISGTHSNNYNRSDITTVRVPPMSIFTCKLIQASNECEVDVIVCHFCHRQSSVLAIPVQVIFHCQECELNQVWIG